MAVLIAVCAVSVIVMLAFFAVRALVTLLIRGAVAGWRHLPPAGRVIAGTVVAFGTADLASMVGLIPAQRWAILLGGGAISAFYGAWLIGWQRVGQRQWRQREHPAVVHGGLDADVSANTKRLAALEREVAMLRRIVSAVGEETHIALPDEMAPRRHLWAVGDDSGPLPKIG